MPGPRARLLMVRILTSIRLLGGQGRHRRLTTVCDIVMRSRRMGRAEAERYVREKRKGIVVSERCLEQLNVWQRCGFDVYEMVHGKKTPKRPYVEWIEKESAGQARPQMDRYCVHS